MCALMQQTIAMRCTAKREKEPNKEMRQMEIPSLDFALGEDIAMLRETVRRFAAEEILPRAEAELTATTCFPADLWKKFGDLACSA